MAVGVRHRGNGRVGVGTAVATVDPTSIPPVAFDHEELVVHCGKRSGTYCIVAVHSTVLGPALGGLRLWRYPQVIDGDRGTPCGSPPG